MLLKQNKNPWPLDRRTTFSGSPLPVQNRAFQDRRVVPIMVPNEYLRMRCEAYVLFSKICHYRDFVVHGFINETCFPLSLVYILYKIVNRRLPWQHRSLDYPRRI